MDEKPDQIIGHIEQQREELGRNLSELETRVRRTTDWRTYYDKNPMLMLGAALGGGVLLGSAFGGRKRSRKSRGWSSGSTAGAAATGFMASNVAHTSSPSTQTSTSRRPAGPATQIQKSKVNETVDHMKAALIAFGISKAKEFLSQAIPGLDRHLSEAEQSRQDHRSSMSGTQSYPGAHSGSQDFRTHTQSPSTSGGESDYRSGSMHEPVGAGSSRPNIP